MMIEDMKLPERPPTPPSMDNILADIEKLRITVDPQFFGAKEILTHIPVHKPGMAEFVRVNPEPAMTFATVIYVDTDNQQQHYIVAPHKYAELAGETKMVTLMLAMSRQGVLFFLAAYLSERCPFAKCTDRDSSRRCGDCKTDLDPLEERYDPGRLSHHAGRGRN
jgi:hypothetical protein